MSPLVNNNVALPFTECDLRVNGDPAVQLMAGAVTDLNVPFNAGEAISLHCGVKAGDWWTFVFSN